jgi:leucyl/phenylalanyl-tRNA--protein transferase
VILDNQITPELLLNAYANGLFPMADSRNDDQLFWVDPIERGILPLNGFHVPRSLAKQAKRDPFIVTTDQAFRQTVQACADSYKGRESTWISGQIEELYCTLHQMGFAHSVECWLDGVLVGGLYGVSLAGAFFGESMFHLQSGASKVALVHLVARLKAGGYSLLDTQFGTEHLEQFGVIEIPRQEYQARLEKALQNESADFQRLSPEPCGSVALQLITQTS